MLTTPARSASRSPDKSSPGTTNPGTTSRRRSSLLRLDCRWISSAQRRLSRCRSTSPPTSDALGPRKSEHEGGSHDGAHGTGPEHSRHTRYESLRLGDDAEAAADGRRDHHAARGGPTAALGRGARAGRRTTAPGQMFANLQAKYGSPSASVIQPGATTPKSGVPAPTNFEPPDPSYQGPSHASYPVP